MKVFNLSGLKWIFLAGACLWLAGCATSKIDWGSRVGSYTYDQAVKEMGPPNRKETLSDGSIVAEWVTAYSPRAGFAFGSGYGHRYRYPYGGVHVDQYYATPPAEWFIRLIFDKDRVLQQVIKDVRDY